MAEYDTLQYCALYWTGRVKSVESGCTRLSFCQLVGASHALALHADIERHISYERIIFSSPHLSPFTLFISLLTPPFLFPSFLFHLYSQLLIITTTPSSLKTPSFSLRSSPFPSSSTSSSSYSSPSSFFNSQQVFITDPHGVLELVLFLLIYEAVKGTSNSSSSNSTNDNSNLGICYVSCTCDEEVWQVVFIVFFLEYTYTLILPSNYTAQTDISF